MDSSTPIPPRGQAGCARRMTRNHQHAHPNGVGATRDPVCGMTVDPPAAGSVEHLGTTYHFCCPGCAAKFRADPRRYLAPSPPRGTTDAGPTAAVYVCPMHPEIVRSRPGFCSICGMALEPRAIGQDRANPELRDMSRR